MLYHSTLFFILFFFILGCGGASEHEPREEKILYFIDSPTNGIDYHCGERQGITKTIIQNKILKHGTLTCIYTPIKFSLGSLELGTVTSVTHGQKIYPQDLIASFNGNFNNPSLLKIAILLQSLDDKKHSNYINIPKMIKEKITLKTLDNLSIEELNNEIKKLGITPITLEEAKRHLILHSENINRGKPSIKAFEEEISTSLKLGDTVGKLSITQGDGTIIFPLKLEGEGKENFILNDDGELQLIKKVENSQTFHLTVTITNEFGYTTQPIILHVIEGNGKIGKAQLGRLKGATVKLFHLNLQRMERELITTEKTNSTGDLNIIGNFNLNSDFLEDDDFYIYEVSLGVDIDSDDNEIIDKEESKNRGKMRLIAKGSWIKNANYKIRVTPLSEMIYLYIEKENFKNIKEKLTQYAKILLNQSLNGDRVIDGKDIIIFNPTQDKKFLYPTLTYKNSYNQITQYIREGKEKLERKHLFQAYLINSFQSNALEIVGSFIYTIDMLQSGEFVIYNLKSKKRIGSLKLPNTPYTKDTHVLYVNLLDNEVTITSLEDWSYEIDINNQKKPKIINDPFITYAILSGNFNRIIIGKSQSKNIYFFSRAQKLYLYETSSSKIKPKTIKVYTTNRGNLDYSYSFSSSLHKISSLWVENSYLYILGETQMEIFKKNIENKMEFKNSFKQESLGGHILGIEKEILYILKDKTLTLLDIHFKDRIEVIEKIDVPFTYKLGVKTNGDYITTGCKIFDIKTLRASRIRD